MVEAAILEIQFFVNCRQLENSGSCIPEREKRAEYYDILTFGTYFHMFGISKGVPILIIV